ncbi:MAG: M20 family metallopeptidase [Geminicoccaceae bacterium]
MTLPSAVELTRRLVRIETVNPPGNEAPAAELAGALLEAAGFAVRRVDLAPGRPSVIAHLAGSDPEAPALGFTGHLDVVPVGETPWRRDPFGGESDGDRMVGRGTADMKGGVAAMVVAACEAARRPRAHAGLELVLTAGEEVGCSGAARIVRTSGVLGRVGALVVGEPTGMAPRFGHRGVTWLRLRFKGRTAHASTPQEGDNAILKAARAALLLTEHGFAGHRHDALGRSTVNVGRIEGGQNLNSVPDAAVLGIDLRTVPGQGEAVILEELSRLVPEAEIEPVVSCPPMWSDPAQPWLARVAERARAIAGGDDGKLSAPFATDAGYLTPAYGGAPTVIVGPGETEQAHKTDEWCSQRRIEQARALYAELIADWCQSS